MIVRVYCILLTLLISLLGSCVQGDKQREIKERERAVELREQEMAALESDYNALLQLRDSLEADGTSVHTVATEGGWPEILQGDWNSRMVCRVPGCANYVIGDQRNELWRFQVDTTGTAYVQVINNDQEVRRFKGSYDGQHVTLSLVTDSTAEVRFHRRALLDNIGTRLVKGTQYLVDQNNCETVFSVELTPREK